MESDYAREPQFWLIMAGSALVGLLSAVGVLVFLALEHLGTTAVWGDHDLPIGWFSGSFIAVIALLVGGLAVGWLRHHWNLTGVDPNFVDELIEGRVSLRHGFRFGTLGLISMVSGASVGPEAPLGTLGAALGTGVAERTCRNATEKEKAHVTADLTFSGISAVFGALGSFTFAGPIMAMETRHSRYSSLQRLLPGVVAATVALVVLYPFVGSPFLNLFSVGTPELHMSWIAWAALYGVVGAALGLVGVLCLAAAKKGRDKVTHPIMLSFGGAVIIAGLGYALPLTLFSGRDQLGPLLDKGPAVGVGLLLAVVAAKYVTFALSMRWGFFGGPMFPMIYIGALVAVALSALFPGVPLAVAVPAVAAGATAVLVPLPLMVIVLTTMMFGLSVQLSVIPSVAVVTAIVLVHGTGVLARMAVRSA